MVVSPAPALSRGPAGGADLPQTLAALGEPHRLAVVQLLRTQPLRSSDIASALDLSRPTTSRHLRVLRRAGLVAERTLEEDARSRIYELRRDPFDALRSWLDELAAFWDDQLASFKTHAERKKRRHPK
ncbi:MAG: metalloregulator ArsR/SmtB family transcription factor [Planctomycetota bacterium]